uniref:helix-turn-helix domain-containing protein n=1 Tax=Lactobacillus taiwanensis TaxID=508451 RepID=UPI00248D201A
MAMNRLKEMRLKHHLHQYDFEKLGFSATTYRKSEQGVRQVSWDEWRKLIKKRLFNRIPIRIGTASIKKAADDQFYLS